VEWFKANGYIKN